MKFKHILAVLLITLLISSCAPALTEVPPSSTAAPTQTATRVPTSTPTLLPATVTPTIAPTSEPDPALSAEGPWLVNLVDPSRYACCGGIPQDGEIRLVNQDGTGYTNISLEACDNVSEFLLDGGNEANLLMQFDKGLYLFRPSEGIGMRIYREVYGNDCHTYYNGDVNGGLLASFYQESEEVSPELILFELPGGEVRERFPLVACGENNPVCEEYHSGIMQQTPKWSPDGRYLAFAAVLDAPSSDIYLYDTQESEVQRLTNRSDGVILVDWSPDGKYIIIQEIEASVTVSSVEVVTKTVQLLYATDSDSLQSIPFWLDNQRFIAFRGEFDPLIGARDLRYVDIKSGANQIIFDGQYIAHVSYDPIYEVFVIFEVGSEGYDRGNYLVSLNNDNVIYLEEKGPPYIYMTYLDWDENTGLFISGPTCEEDSSDVVASDHFGNLQCIPNPSLTSAPVENPSYPAPNEEWTASVQEGLWLETGDEPAVQVSNETAGEVVWCPDSSCFFFTAGQKNNTWTLYHVSPPDLTTTTVAEGIRVLGDFQWLGAE